MERGSRRRDKKVRRTAGTCGGDGGELPTRIGDVPEELLELVLLRARTPLCVYRAAATCKLWRRVIKGDGFLCRLRSLRGHNSHLLLGHYSVTTEPDTDRIDTEFVPSPPPRPAIDLGQRISLDFLIRPGGGPYHQRELSDSRGGLLAIVCDNRYAVVCDPCTRQLRELRFSWGQEGQPPRPWYVNVFYRCIGVFLLDGDGTMSSFRVLCACMMQNNFGKKTAVAHVFSARDDRWLQPSFDTAVTCECIDIMYSRSRRDYMYELFVGRAGGSVFWATKHNYVLVLDESTVKFSTFWLPMPHDAFIPYQYHSRKNLRVVAAGGGDAGTVRIVRVVNDNALEVLTARRSSHGSWEYVHRGNET